MQRWRNYDAHGQFGFYNKFPAHENAKYDYHYMHKEDIQWEINGEKECWYTQELMTGRGTERPGTKPNYKLN